MQLTAATQKIKPVGVAGGGVRIPISDRIGLRADARIYFSGNRDETFVSAVPPNRTSGVSSGYFEIGTAPAIQLQSNPQSPNSQVSFSGPTLSNFRTFQGTGLQTDLVLSVGAFWRF